jgi:hypothetical protein
MELPSVPRHQKVISTGRHQQLCWVTSYNHRWAILLEQQTSTIVHRLPTLENKVPLSVSVCSKQTVVAVFFLFRFLYIQLYVHVYIYTHIHTHIYTCIHTYTFTNTYRYTSIYIHIHINMYTYTHMYMHLYMYIKVGMLR